MTSSLLVATISAARFGLAQERGAIVTAVNLSGLAVPIPGARVLPGGNRVDAVGESFYSSALIEIMGISGESFGSTMMWASLVPDPANPYDPNAIKVMIGGKQVGCLDRAAAIVFGPVATRIIELGCEAQCAATIVGAKGRFGVVLDLGTPDECLRELG